LVRASGDGTVVQRLYIKSNEHTEVEFTNIFKAIDNIEVFYFDQMRPKAHIKLWEKGSNELHDELTVAGGTQQFTYAIDSFYQVNPPVYQAALSQMAGYLGASAVDPAYAGKEEVGAAAAVGPAYAGKEEVGAASGGRVLATPPFPANAGANAAGVGSVSPSEARSLEGKTLVDMYSGVGTIGLTLAAALNGKAQVTLVELDQQSVKYAKVNSAAPEIRVIKADAKHALKHITPGCTLVVDPPRAGLDKSLVRKILEAKPAKLLYLSCNPSTQARDLAKLKDAYSLDLLQGYNFFPKTPHIESLAALTLLP
jgi:tRNA/tmRNA/rRNA uracil-C5-methylase (TrmA/RlmC/RlmD family)